MRNLIEVLRRGCDTWLSILRAAPTPSAHVVVVFRGLYVAFQSVPDPDPRATAQSTSKFMHPGHEECVQSYYMIVGTSEHAGRECLPGVRRIGRILIAGYPRTGRDMCTSSM